MVLFFVILALVFVVLLVIITNIVIVPQSKVYVCLLYTSVRCCYGRFVQCVAGNSRFCAGSKPCKLGHGDV